MYIFYLMSHKEQQMLAVKKYVPPVQCTHSERYSFSFKLPDSAPQTTLKRLWGWAVPWRSSSAVEEAEQQWNLQFKCIDPIEDRHSRHGSAERRRPTALSFCNFTPFSRSYLECSLKTGKGFQILSRTWPSPSFHHHLSTFQCKSCPSSPMRTAFWRFSTLYLERLRTTF